MFKRWIKTNEEASKELMPDLGLRKWDDLSKDEKHRIWKHLEQYFFEPEIKEDHQYGWTKRYYEFSDKSGITQKRIHFCILIFNRDFKAKNYTPNYLENSNINNACTDFRNIFTNQTWNVVLELISVYSLVMIREQEAKKRYKNEWEDDESFNQRVIDESYSDFDEFSEDLNDVFSDFWINVLLTRLGFTPRQEEKINEDIYKPVLKKLSHTKWKEVEKLLKDSFIDYANKDFSWTITHWISSLQAFLQLLVHWKTGTGDISKLIPQARAKMFIPDDDFSLIFFDQIESYLARVRKDLGDAHPKKSYATEKNARLVLNLLMVLFEHSL